jgi:hypothetical protein
MRISVPTSGGWTFEAELEEDEWHMLWLNAPNRVTGKRQSRCLLTAVLKIGWAYRERVTRGAGAARGARVRQPKDPVMNDAAW